MRDEKLHAVVARSTCASEKAKKKLHVRALLEVVTCRKKVHAVVARSTFASEKVQKPLMFGALLEVVMSKKCTPLRREAHFEVKMLKAPHAGTTFGSWDVEKVHAVVARSTFPSQNVKSTTCSCRFAWQAQGIVHLLKSEQNVRVWGFCSISKNDGRRGTLKRICKVAFRVAGAVQKTCSSEMLGGQGADFLRGVAFWSIRSVGTVGLLRWFCVTGAGSTSYDLASIFRGRRSTFDRRSGKIAKRIGTRPSALHSTFHVWRMSRRIALFLMLSSSKIEDVSQNCFVFDVIKLEKLKVSRRIASFWMLSSSTTIEEVPQNCFVFDVVMFEKLKKSGRIASFWMLSSSTIEEVSQNCFFLDAVKFKKIEEVSQNCCVFDVVKFKNWGSLAE